MNDDLQDLDVDCSVWPADVFPAGSRVVLTEYVERYPHFVVSAGSLGVVVDIGDPNILAVRLDERLEGAEDWANEVHWILDAGDDPARSLRRIEPIKTVQSDPDKVPREVTFTPYVTVINTVEGFVASFDWSDSAINVVLSGGDVVDAADLDEEQRRFYDAACAWADESLTIMEVRDSHPPQDTRPGVAINWRKWGLGVSVEFREPFAVRLCLRIGPLRIVGRTGKEMSWK